MSTIQAGNFNPRPVSFRAPPSLSEGHVTCGETYDRQVRLLVRVIPSLATEKAFVLKGGAVINLFVRNMPRLSVDIDLA